MAAHWTGHTARGLVTTDLPVVIIDTNALMMPVEVGVQTFSELERLLGAADYVVPEPVLAELRRFANKTGKERSAAIVGEELATDYCRSIETNEESADNAIAALARENVADYVVTNDASLRQRVLDERIPVISLRGRNKLTILEP